MSSREIDELTGKRHPDVRRDIRYMLQRLRSGELEQLARVCNGSR